MTQQKNLTKAPIVDVDPIDSWDDEGGAAVCGDQSTCKLHERSNDETPETKKDRVKNDKKGRPTV